MTSLLCGLAAACCWASTNVLAARVVRGSDPNQFAFWLNLLGCAIAAPVGLAQLSSAHVSPDDVLWLALTGVGAAATGLLLTRALRHGQLGVVGPLMSLEGAIAAVLGIAFAAESVPGIELGGIAVSIVGAVTVAFGATRRGHLAGSSYALPAAACAGVALWAFAQQPLAPLLALMIARFCGATALLPTLTKLRLPRGIGWLLGIAALDVLANALFLLGARAGSLSTTAVLAAQFGTLTAIGGVWHWKESLSMLQIAGLLVIAAGVTAIAAG
ncbi:MAG TPA: DMT family transporter [Solirubrobacteraceae bacterium]|nr:DMT family transporter [Solirubrobacteraceae bacterium]